MSAYSSLKYSVGTTWIPYYTLLIPPLGQMTAIVEVCVLGPNATIHKQLSFRFGYADN